MKILVLIHEFPPVGGGGGRVAYDLCRGLAARGHELRVLTDSMAGLPEFETLDGVLLQRVGAPRRAPFRAELGEMARYDWKALWVGLKLLRRWKADLIHAHFAVPAGAVAFLLSKLTRTPYVLTAHLGDVPGASPEKTAGWFRWMSPFIPPIWKGAARVVAVSEFTRSLARKHYQVPMEIIHNGVDFSALPAWQASSGIPRIVFAGRFVPQKNPEHLAQALLRLADLPWTCAMLGDGPLLEPVRALVTAAGLQDRFDFPGWVTPGQVLEQFARSDILALPSRSEGLSVVGVQGLAMGLAMVLSDAGGNPELVQNGENGFLLPPSDLDALIDALRTLLLSPAVLQRAQAKSRELARAFDLDVIVTQYEHLLASV